MRFATRMLLLQVACVLAVTAACTAVFLLLATQQLRAEAGSTALGIARTIASQDEVRADVAAESGADDAADAAELREGPLQQLAEQARTSTDALFIVIVDASGRRLSHPDPERVGQPVSTDYTAALAGRETVTWERGTLGDSARAKVPVYAPGSDNPVGEVSVGFDAVSVFADLPALVAGIGLAALIALVLGLVVSFLLRRRLERSMLGLQPEELVALVHNQSAVLDGVGDGVIGVDPGGVVRVCNRTAAEMLDLDNPIGRPASSLRLPDRLLRALDNDTPLGPIDGVSVNDRIIYLDTRDVRRDGRDLGRVAVLRDRTQVVALAERLEAVGSLSNALRAQRHEFANRLHATAGLIDADRVTEARTFLDELLDRGPLRSPAVGLDRISDPYLQSFVGAKAVEAAERNVVLRVGEETLLIGSVHLAEDVATVLGNLLDNAVDAAVRGPEPRSVDLTLLDDGDELIVTITDSGPGVAAPELLFRGRDTPPELDSVHGHGIGLPLSREIARSRGGDVWLLDAGGDGRGATVCARIPGAMTMEAS